MGIDLVTQPTFYTRTLNVLGERWKTHFSEETGDYSYMSSIVTSVNDRLCMGR